MSEEVTYATLSFQDSTGAGNNQNRNNLRKKGFPDLSHTWRWAALSLLTLCLLLLTGLVTLGIMFLQISNEINSDSENLSPPLKTVHHQQDNLSQQLSNDSNFSMEEELLKSQISNLLKKQGQMAIKLCQELVIHTSGHKCNPCPKMWQWHQNSCYYFATNKEKTWSNSRKDCMDKNSTLVKIDSLEEKHFLKSQPLIKFSFFWLGLSWDPSGRSWLWEDGSSPSPSLFNTREYVLLNGSQGCAYFQGGNTYTSRCSAEISWICEKTAALVKIEDLD
ncbi:C-type lectin domain family 12 member B isoform X2 [Pipistrellus kuhlii]|uniref:C-type lectin domain family 12 member B isoform X2 n=1 Tax=Pipistrellus kuhlii TaxID=59472 RepID=UPI001E270C9B|nr:C-type lectin domain family 12 member B isoform X2 [Pipistrellus kuhlii]